MYIVAASFLGYFALLIDSDFWGPERLGFVPEYTHGYALVQDVRSNSLAERAGLKEGDHLLAIDGIAIQSQFDWIVAESHLQVHHPHRLGVIRGKSGWNLS